MATTDLTTEVEALVGDLASVRAPRGSELRCKGWHQEAALRERSAHMDADRSLSAEIEDVAGAIRGGSLVGVAEGALGPLR